ncbi:anaerobic ribonucleoside-triphosphate reductase activating protein [Chlorobium sp. N1]|uniref:anaerobic ribonucleoside-triphosphate reductase activating protein n=1 Tax=Chlorobium sp. N1 TaxID=2491138 RepID=UPI00103D0D28|nr:anaerobic ribonucleoside-triphosphate reductase activating protein [Chlorobium sp. N1]TCD47471.1 anaerobic ribonucleoside-triphosphate reductase activating protein [Chlorobium sp. N1]
MSGPVSLPVGGFLPQSLVDWPGRVAAVVYTSGCNFRCPFCHNPELVLPKEFGAPPLIPFEEALERIAQNRNLLGGVVVTGGEPTIHDSLPDALRALKKLGLKVKLDTNGSRPEMLGRLIGEGLVDEVAMDVKAPLEPEAYSRLTGIDCPPELLGRIRDSLLLLRRSGVSHRLRCTVVKGLHTKEDVVELTETFGPALTLQRYRAGKTLGELEAGPFDSAMPALSEI